MNSKLETSLLYDFYGALLQDSQKKVVELYVNDDLSLSEAADLLGISRQGVHDSLDRACRNLREYEEKLGLLAKYEKAGVLAGEADGIISGLESKISGADCAAGTAASGNGADLKRLRDIIAALASND